MDLYIVRVTDEAGDVWKADRCIKIPAEYTLLARLDWKMTAFSRRMRSEERLPEPAFDGELLPDGVEVDFTGDVADIFSPGRRTTDCYGSRLTSTNAGTVFDALRAHVMEARMGAHADVASERWRSVLDAFRSIHGHATVILYWS